MCSSITVEMWLPIIQRQLALVLECAERILEAMQRGATDEEVDRIRHETYEALIRLDEVVPDGVRSGLRPEFKRGFDLTLARLLAH